MLFKYVAVFCSVVLVVDGRVVKESVLLFKGPYCRSAFVAVFKYVTVFCLVVLVVDGRVVKESVLLRSTKENAFIVRSHSRILERSSTRI